MKNIFLLLLVGFLSQSIAAQTSVESTEGVKIEHSVEDANATDYQKCSSKSSDKKASACSKDKKSEGCSKSSSKKESSKKCSKEDKCCTKTGKTVADCDNKSKGCCKSTKKPTI